MRLLAPLAVVLFLLTGCAHYEYNLTQPPELRTHIGTKDFARVTIDPLEYRLITVDNRLVMEVFNPTADPIQLAGSRCSVVDPAGQSHPLPEQAIAPGSFVKLILPPVRPTYEQTGPSIGIGFGAMYGRPYRRAGFIDPYYDGAFYGEPRYFTVYDPSNAFYWDWDGETDVRMTLVYLRGGQQFTHSLAFHRQKM